MWKRPPGPPYFSEFVVLSLAKLYNSPVSIVPATTARALIVGMMVAVALFLR
jgi:hypothetical protein